MNSLILQLGRETELCRAELRNIAALHGLQFVSAWEDLAEVRSTTDSPIAEAFFTDLGGAIRAVEPSATLEDALGGKIAAGEILLPSGPWALSALSPDLGHEREEVRQAIRALVESTPDLHGRELRPAPGEQEVVPAKIAEDRVLDRGGELCLWRDSSGRIQVGQTRWVFEVEGFAERDFGKPHRPQKRGLLPPKLARQMINLARTSKTWDLHDPFCGSGVVLLEGLSLGLSVGGSDNRDEAIDQTRKNLRWYESVRPGVKGQMRRLERIDARQLSKKIEPLSIGAVVGEGDLGPPIRGKLSRKAAIEFRPRLEELYTTCFAEIRIVLVPGGRVCVAVPFWQPNEGDPIFLNLERRLALAGYQPVFPERGFDPLLYRRKDQRVGRAVYLLESPE
jgi:hypothetical protein